MRLSASIELVMQFATYEAIGARFGEIEPEHLLMGLLKFGELPVGEMEKLLSGASAAKQLVKEVEAVSKELARRGIESKKVRRELRTKKGKGSGRFSGGRMHRSAISRQIFNVAAKLADDAGSDAVTAEHILESLMIAPTRVIEEVLGDAVGAKVREHKETPLLDKYGRDLTKLAADGNKYPGTDRIIEGKALVSMLSQPDGKSVLLVTDDEAAASRTVVRAAQTIAMKDDCPAAMKGKIIVAVTGLKTSGKWDRKSVDEFVKVYAEAAAVEDTILFAPTMESAAEGGANDEWPNLLQQTLSKGSVQCICRVGSVAYRDSVKGDAAWKRLAHVIWIHDEIKGEIPLEL
jgi:ATP-dependent Clp protease ATP-binding subunit ClpC